MPQILHFINNKGVFALFTWFSETINLVMNTIDCAKMGHHFIGSTVYLSRLDCCA